VRAGRRSGSRDDQLDGSAVEESAAEREEARPAAAVLELDRARLHARDRAAEAVAGDLDDEIRRRRHTRDGGPAARTPVRARTSPPYRSNPSSCIVPPNRSRYRARLRGIHPRRLLPHAA
jgi:hypothetical protein